MPGKIGKAGRRRAGDSRLGKKNSLLAAHRGVTMIEVLIALVVLLVVFMGLIQAALLSIDHNVRNKVRDEAVRIAAEAMTAVKSEGFDGSHMADNSGSTYAHDGTNYSGALLPAGVGPGANPSRNFGNFPQPYTVGLEVAQTADGLNKQVTIRVHYTYRTDPPVTYTINSVVASAGALNP